MQCRDSSSMINPIILFLAFARPNDKSRAPFAKEDTMRVSNWRTILTLLILVFGPAANEAAERKSYLLAYISDSANASPAYWVAKERGIFKKYGLDIELIYISGSTRGVQSLIAGDVAFVGAVGTSALYGKLAGGDVAIVNSLTNTLPYYIIGRPEIRSTEDF